MLFHEGDHLFDLPFDLDQVPGDTVLPTTRKVALRQLHPHQGRGECGTQVMDIGIAIGGRWCIHGAA